MYNSLLLSLTLNRARSVAKNAYHSLGSLRAAPPSHHIDDSGAEPASKVSPTRAEGGKEEEEEEEGGGGGGGGGGSSAPDFNAWQDISGSGDRSRPNSSSTERHDQRHPPYTHEPEGTSTDVGGGPATEPHPDLDLDDEGYVESDGTSASFLTSIDSVVEELVEENNRFYPNYGKYEYGLPVDEEERERMLVQHRKFSLVLKGQQFLSPIVECPQKILDVGTGMGLWAMEVADRFPMAVVTGVDVAAIQPQFIPPTCEFEILDVEEPWPLRKDSFDFIHMRDLMFLIRDWPKLVGQSFEHLKPGGWLELSCTYLAPASDSGRMPDSSEFRRVCEKLVEASKVFGAPTDCPLHFVEQLQRAGFVHVTKHEFRIPSCPWSDDERLKEIGTLDEANLIAGASTFGLRVFERAFGWPRATTEVRMVGFRGDLANREYRQYCTQ